MSYRYVLPLLGCILIVYGAGSRDGRIALVWLGGNFVALGFAHALGLHGTLGKRSNGTISGWGWFLFLPLLTFTAAVWHLVRLFSREPTQNVLTQDIVVGRRLLPFEIIEDSDNYVDLTAEFAEPPLIRRSASYICFPILDGAAPAPDELLAAISRLRPGRTYIHCAQGHGRTGMFALAMLLSRGISGSVEDGLWLLEACRPGIRLNKQQLICIRRYAEKISSTTIDPPRDRSSDM